MVSVSVVASSATLVYTDIWGFVQIHAIVETCAMMVYAALECLRYVISTYCILSELVCLLPLDHISRKEHPKGRNLGGHVSEPRFTYCN